MVISCFRIDAFTDRLFAGNPAAVCPLDRWLDDVVLQQIAAENNLSETAFFVREGDGFALRWFTPTVEVDICGHATLASAHVVFEELGWSEDVVQFDTKSGRLGVRKIDDGRLELDFPSVAAEPVDPGPLADAMGVSPVAAWRAWGAVAELANETAVRAFEPNLAAIRELEGDGLIVTAAGDGETDFVSRCFFPGAGIDEDPVTGSAHCILAPLWAQKLGKTELEARQVSSRGGRLHCAVDGPRVRIAGQAVLFARGEIPGISAPG